VDFTVNQQEVVGLLGDNGAGKSTLIKVLTGVYPPSSGKIYFEGRPVDISSPRVARSLGIETCYQDLALVPLMSITRNFFLGRELLHSLGPVRWLDLAEMDRQSREALRDIGIRIRSPREKVGKLSGGERQSIAIGRARHFGAKLLILDEPTSALSVGETHKVLTYTLNAKERGLSVIFITHNVGHVYQVADRFVIIRHGEMVGSYSRDEVNEKDIADLITGERER
jgi:simple sugar transport system ATP-binding protein